MATYTETVYASSSNNGVSRAEYRVAMDADGNITWGDYSDPYSETRARINFPALSLTSLPKKQLQSVNVYGYVLSRSGTYTGAPYSGSFLYGRILSAGGIAGFWRYTSIQNQSDWRYLSEFTLSSYNLIAKTDRVDSYWLEYFKNPEIGVGVGTSQGFQFYTNRQHTVIAAMSIATATSANPPYAIRTFVDAVPWPISMVHNEGRYFSENQVNTFTWDMDWRRDFVGGTLNLAASIFKWRIKGTTTEYSTNFGAGVRYASVPAGTFPNADIQWGIVVTTDDNVSSTTYWGDLPHVKAAPLQLLNFAPQAGFVNEKTPVTFNWSIEYLYQFDTDGNIIGGEINIPIVQESATIQWRNIGAANINSITVTGSATSITVPANTFPDGFFEWRVLEATTIDGGTADSSPWFVLTTIDQPHTRPTSLQPSGGWKNGTREIQFSWVVHSPLNSEQTAYEIEISKGNVEWLPLSGKVQSITPAFLLAPEALERGTVFWRVRTYNTDDDVSPWSEVAAFVVKTAPSPPQWVGVTQGRSRPTVEWIGEDQVGWRLQVARGSETLYDSGERLGVDNTFQIPIFLPNGQYIFRIMSMNELSLWSDWSDFNVAISFRSRLTIELNGKEVEFGANLTFDVGVRP